MSIVWQILIALLVLNLLVIVHEFGHYIAARSFHVKVHEFAIGMGPKLFTIHGKHNDFSLRLFPIGGFVAMEGEDEESSDPDAFGNKKPWKKFIIVCAGALMNLLLGLILTFGLVLNENVLVSTKVDSFHEGATSCEYGLQADDEILKIDSTHIWIYSDIIYALARNQTGVVDFTVRRDGVKVVLEDVQLPTEVVGKVTTTTNDFYLLPEGKTFGNVLRHGFFRTVSLGKAVYYSLFDLIRGKYSLDAVSGPVGTVEYIGEAASQGMSSLVYLSAFISVNLGIFNLLPLPALDGGRLLFIILEMIRRKPIPAKYEGIVHMVGFVLLIAFVLLVTFNDIKGLVTKGMILHFLS